MCRLKCDELKKFDTAAVGYVEFPGAESWAAGAKVHSWGGKDIKGKWPEFERMLHGFDELEHEDGEETSELSVGSET